MSTYKNCYRLVRDVRQGIDEFDDALASGEDTVGAFTNEYIVDRLNETIAELHAFLLKRRPNEFIKEVSVAGVNSVFPLPADFGKLVLFRNQYGRKVLPMSQIERRLVDQGGSERLYYQRGRNLLLDAAGVSATYSLIYKPRARDIHMGRVAVSSTDSITLQANQRKALTDYYNGMTIENERAGWVCEISDYTAAGVAVTTDCDSTQGDLYGLVPELPEWAWPLIAPKTIIACKLRPISKEPPSSKEIDTYEKLFRTIIGEFATLEDDDQDVAEMFSKFEPIQGGEIMS